MLWPCVCVPLRWSTLALFVCVASVFKYVICVGRLQMSIKIATNHQPEDLLRRNGALSRLTTLIENTETYDPDTQQ